MTCPDTVFERIIKPNNSRQDFVNEEMRSSMYDDGILDIYIDRNGLMRDNAVDLTSTENADYIIEALDYFEEVTGIEMNYVDSEFKSELSFHQLSSEPLQGFERWAGVPSNTAGLIHSKGNQDTNIYFENQEDPGLTKTIIFHEIAHAFGAYELQNPGTVTSSQSIMGYDYNGFFGYTESDQTLFETLY